MQVRERPRVEDGHGWDGELEGNIAALVPAAPLEEARGSPTTAVAIASYAG